MYNMQFWETSGHAANYKDNMFVFEVEKQEFALKPMNCLGHCLMFDHRVPSYRDDDDDEYEEGNGGNRLLGFMFGNVDGSRDLHVDYLDEVNNFIVYFDLPVYMLEPRSFSKA